MVGCKHGPARMSIDGMGESAFAVAEFVVEVRRNENPNGASGQMTPKRYLPSIADIFFLALFLCLTFLSGQKLLGDPDTGYHIRVGDFILDTGTMMRHDVFSYHVPPLPCNIHEWGSEVIMALVHRAAGLGGIVVLFAFLISLISYMLFRMIRIHNGNIIVAIFVAIVAITTTGIHWLARPHIFSLLLMLIWYSILDVRQHRRGDHLRFLPLLMILWVNLHGGFVAGFVFLGVYLIGNLVGMYSGAGAQTDRSRDNVLAILKTSAWCLVAALLNPQGYHLLIFPFELLSNRFMMDCIGEFLSPNFHEFAAFKYMLLLTIAILAWSREKIDLIELMLVLVFANMALYSIRYIPLFAVAAAPIIARRADRSIEEAGGFLKERAERICAIDGASRGFFWPAAAVLVVVVCAALGHVSYTFDPKIQPVDAVEFLRKERVPGRMFNEYDFGDYIIYAIPRDYKVFIDGRADMYGAAMMKEYFKVGEFKPGWDEVLKKYEVGWMIFTANSTLSRFLLERGDWKLIYADKVANVFVRTLPEYQYLIDKYKAVKPAPPEEEDDAA